MYNYNHVVLMGRLTRNPDKKVYGANNEKSCVNFSIAINKFYNDKSGIEKKKTDFIDCKAFDKKGNDIYSYFKKGRPIFIDGHLQLEKWVRKDGSKAQGIFIIVDSYEYLDSKKDNDNSCNDPCKFPCKLPCTFGHEPNAYLISL